MYYFCIDHNSTFLARYRVEVCESVMLVSAADSRNNILILYQKRWSKGNAVSFNQQKIMGCVEETAVAENVTLTVTTDPFQ